jgi:Acyl-CoA dehydrogenases
MARLSASEIAMVVTPQAIQIHDEMGSSKQLPVEHRWRDTKNTEIYEGKSELQWLASS